MAVLQGNTIGELIECYQTLTDIGYKHLSFNHSSEAYLSWCKGDRNNDWDKADYRVNNLIKRLGNNINLYLKFYQCDNETGDKEAHCFTWFKNRIK